MRLFVLGATGHTGTELVDLALKRGHRVTAFVRTPGKMTWVPSGLTVVQGNLEDVEGMARAMEWHEAVFSTLGPKMREVFTPLEKRSWTMEGAIRNILAAMGKAHVGRLALFSSSGLFPEELEGFFARLLMPLGRHHMKDLKGMEEAVSQSPVDWTIARPTWLGKGVDESYRVQPGARPPQPHKMTFRALAKFLLDSVEQGTNQKQIVGLAR